MWMRQRRAGMRLAVADMDVLISWRKKTIMKTTKKLFGILTITAALAVSVQAQSFLTNGLVAYFPLNGNANDASGNGNNGFAENTFATTNQFGQADSALGFAGNSWVYVPYSASLFTTNYTVSMMFNCKTNFASNGSGNFCLLRSGNASTDYAHGYEIAAVDFGQNFGFWDFSGDFVGGGKCVTPINNWQQNQWYNLTFTRNGLVAQLYVNGTLVASVTNSTPYTPAQSSPLYIGANTVDPATSDPTVAPWDFFTGIISDVRFYNRGLSSTEVQQLYFYESGSQVNLVKAVKPSFNYLRLGNNYQLQVSTDLNTWTNQGSAFTATNTSMVYPQYWDVDNWNQLFFRLQLAP
jgi:hypothetical protein